MHGISPLSLHSLQLYFSISKDIVLVNWTIVITLAFEVLYIAWQASKGQASHYNQSSPFYAFMFSMMALAASVATLAVGYIGLKFFATSLPDLPSYYVWAIRIGFILFVIFSFEGFVMGSQSAHTVGAADGGAGLPFLNWSISHGDLRIAHFVGMHALQVLPFLAWYLFKDMVPTLITALLYGFMAFFILIQSLQGNSIIKI